MTTKQIKLFDSTIDLDEGFPRLCQELDVSYDEPRWPDVFGQSLQHYLSETSQEKPIKTLSLFTGAGGLDIGFHDAGYEIQLMVEINKRFVATLKRNTASGAYLQGAKSLCVDIREFDPLQFKDIDFIIGGPPCQTFSAAGRRAAGVQGIDDSRGVLFQEYVRILKSIKPKGFLFENVYGITGAQNGRAFEVIKKHFQDAGYSISYRILDSADFGVPQHRERLFIIGSRSASLRFPSPTHGPDSNADLPFYSAGLAVQNAPITTNEAAATVKGRFGPLLSEIPAGLNYSFFTEKMGHPTPIFAWRSKFSDFLYKAEPDTPSRTLKAQGGQYTGPFHWDNRPFSLGELKRLQTIPDDYIIEGSRQTAIHQIGNSVPPQLARILALAVRQQLFDQYLTIPLCLLPHRAALGFRSRKRALTATYQRKASEAISALSKSNKNTIQVRSRRYHGILSDGFAWSEIPRQTKSRQSTLAVSFRVNKRVWRIRVGFKKNNNPAFSICVFPNAQQGWALPVNEVYLDGASIQPEIFTAAWKAFELEVSNAYIKADLVQLCEYYQYPPRLHAEMSVFSHAKQRQLWVALSAIVAGYGVRHIIKENELAKELNIQSNELQHFTRFLRSLGYEVRNRETNPQIPFRHYLIPYIFPTLTPVSVQLRKSLGEPNDNRVQ